MKLQNCRMAGLQKGKEEVAARAFAQSFLQSFLQSCNPAILPFVVA
jgi:hypothetical protein